MGCRNLDRDALALAHFHISAFHISTNIVTPLASVRRFSSFCVCLITSNLEYRCRRWEDSFNTDDSAMLASPSGLCGAHSVLATSTAEPFLPLSFTLPFVVLFFGDFGLLRSLLKWPRMAADDSFFGCCISSGWVGSILEARWRHGGVTAPPLYCSSSLFTLLQVSGYRASLSGRAYACWSGTQMLPVPVISNSIKPDV